MANKRRKGESKREYAARMAGGTLNYKTGKISVPAKKSSGTSKQTTVASNFVGPLATNQTRDPNVVLDEYGQGYSVAPSKQAAWQEQQKTAASSGSKSSSKKVNTNQRSQAADIARKVLGVETANASGGTPTPVRGGTITAAPSKKWWERGIEIMTDPFGLQPRARALFNDMPWGNKITQSEQPGNIISGLLPEFGLSEKYLGDTSGIFGTENQPPQTYNQPYNPTTPTDVISQGQGPINVPGVTDQRTSNRTPSPVSSPVSSPFVPQNTPFVPQLGISSAYSPQSQPDYSSNQPDNATVQRLAGQGIFSTGQFGNGSGDYGISGTFGGGGALSDEQNLLNQLLGITTANAQDAREGMEMSSMSNITPDAMQAAGLTAPMGGYQGLGQGTGNQGYSEPTGGQPNNPVFEQLQNQGDYYGKQQKQQEKAFKAQEKAQKKALEELINSIKAQYGQSQTEGTTSLEKQKQEDMLKLSGLFGFANQDPNSEQRIQYQNRLSGDYANQLSDFISKLSAAQGQDISGARQNYQNQIGNLASQRQSALQALQQQQMENQMKMAQLMQQAQPKRSSTAASSKAPSHQEIFDWVNGAIQAGGNWQEIAEQAAANGISTATGSYLDQLLNNANKQGVWR